MTAGVPAMLLAWDADGMVVATLDQLVALDAAGTPRGLVDFAELEARGTALVEVWRVNRAVGSGCWPEWLGGRAHDFRVELEPSFRRGAPRGARPEARIAALVHRVSGLRRERRAVEEAIAARIAAAAGAPADIRDLVGGPGRPLRVDDEGRTLGRSALLGAPPELPVVNHFEIPLEDRGRRPS